MGLFKISGRREVKEILLSFEVFILLKITVFVNHNSINCLAALLLCWSCRLLKLVAGTIA